KKDVAPELPPKTELARPVELTGKQRELSESIRVSAHADVRRAIRKKGLAASAIPILGALMKLRQVCCDPRLAAMDAATDVLVSADTVVHYDPWWNPASQMQATDRAYRIGQTKPVFVYNLYVAGSVEERVIELQRRKRWLSDGVLGQEAGPTAISERDVEELL